MVRSPTPLVLADVIADDMALASVAAGLNGKKRVAVDTEAASFHRYHDRIYLIQLSSDDRTVIIDPLAVARLDPIGKLLVDPRIEVVFHGADYDLRVLDRDYKYRAKNVFDTKVAAELLGESGVGLGHLLEKYFGIKLNKKLQRADWSRRPLTPEMISYAAADTHHLLALRDELENQLRQRGRLAWAQEEFSRLERIRWELSAANGQGFLRLKGAKALTRRRLAVLRAVYQWRDQTAKQADRAPFRIVGNEALLVIARSTPTKRAALGKLSGVPASVVRRYGDDLLEAIRTGLSTPEEDWPKIERTRRPKVDPAADDRLERLKLLRNRVARELGIQAGILCPNGSLQAIARTAPSRIGDILKIGGMRRWQRDALGAENLLQAVGNK